MSVQGIIVKINALEFVSCICFQSDYLFARQDEEKLLLAVEDCQNKLLELKNQLLSKKSQVAAAKAKLDQKTQSLQEINK